MTSSRAEVTVDDRAGRPHWAERLRRERSARGWTHSDAVRALRATSSTPLPADAALLRTWKGWEAGTLPDDFYRPLLARTLGTVTSALFPADHRSRAVDVPAGGGMETLEIVARVRAADLDDATMDALRLTVDRLCSDYPHASSEALRVEGRQWLRRLTGLTDGRLTPRRHREVLALAGWLALLVGCVENDMGERSRAEATRRAAMSLGAEAGHGEIAGWAYEMSAWFALTAGDLPGVVAASDAGQTAKAWARMGNRRRAEVALDQGRGLLESMRRPNNLDHHFVVDPAKFDLYSMDCYRLLGEDGLAEAYADEVLRLGVGPDGSERSPMRNAEARITLGVVAARRGDLEEAVAHGRRALVGPRRSLPSLAMATGELAGVLLDRFGDERQVADYVRDIRALAKPSSE